MNIGDKTEAIFRPLYIEIDDLEQRLDTLPPGVPKSVIDGIKRRLEKAEKKLQKLRKKEGL